MEHVEKLFKFSYANLINFLCRFLDLNKLQLFLVVSTAIKIFYLSTKIEKAKIHFVPIVRTNFLFSYRI